MKVPLILPPGVRFATPLVLKLLLPPLAVCVTWFGGRVVFHLAAPTWLLWFLCVISIPAALGAYVAHMDFKRESDARRHGAILPSGIEPWGLELLDKIRADVDEVTNNLREVDWLKEYGRVSSWRVYFVDTIIVSEPEYLKRILVTDIGSYEKGYDLTSPLSQILGNGIFTSDGDMWKFHRSMTRPFFTKDRISQFGVFEEHANTVIDLIRSRSKEGVPVNWQDLAYRFTLDSATTFLFGVDVHSLSEGLAYPPGFHRNKDLEANSMHKRAHVYARALQAGLVLTANRIRYGRAWPLLEFREDKLREHMKVIDSFLEPIIEENLRRRAEKGYNEKDCKADENLLEYLTRWTDDVKLIKDQTMNILLGGRDTIASTLTSSVFNLTKYPDICRRLHQEILDSVGQETPTFEDIRQMKYLKAFINEVLRLFPPAPIMIRSTRTGIVWPSVVPDEKPIYIPPNTRIVMPLLITHRRTDLWGPDAAKFDPDRFLDERLNKYLTPNPMIFLPFNAGPRICLGQQFSYNVASFMLVRLLQQFSKFELVQYEPGSVGPGCVRFDTHITMFIEGELWVKMTEASEDGATHA